MVEANDDDLNHMTCCQYKAGDLRNAIEIRFQNRTTDEYGGAVTTWDLFASTKAKITPVKGSERWSYDRIEATVTHKIVTRFVLGVTPAMRIWFGSRVFRIVSVLNVDEQSRWLELVCEERDGDRQ